uniref:Uncharacterized protein n=1 Tax=Arundo donax TaxID=35708 RepID=A0A0A8ZWA2_ARUDO
MLKVKVGK